MTAQKPVITRRWGSRPRSWAAGTTRAHQGRPGEGRKPTPFLAREPKWRLPPWLWSRDNECSWKEPFARVKGEAVRRAEMSQAQTVLGKPSLLRDFTQDRPLPMRVRQVPEVINTA